MLKLGIIREGKTPPDKRVALTPEQCKFIMDNYQDVEIAVQKNLESLTLATIDQYYDVWLKKCYS